MLKEIVNYIKTHTILIALNIMVLTFVSSVYIYDHFQVQNEIISLADIIHHESVDRKCSAAGDRLLIKIGALTRSNAIPNSQVSDEVMAAYQVGLGLATKDDIRCLIMEHMGDMIWFAYRAGVKDGTKNNYVGGV